MCAHIRWLCLLGRCFGSTCASICGCARKPCFGSPGASTEEQWSHVPDLLKAGAKACGSQLEVAQRRGISSQPPSWDGAGLERRSLGTRVARQALWASALLSLKHLPRLLWKEQAERRGTLFYSGGTEENLMGSSGQAHISACPCSSRSLSSP